MPSENSPDIAAFWHFEHCGWQQVAVQYHTFFSSLTTQTIPALLHAVLPAARKGGRVRLLDMATGPGYVAAAAAQRGVSAVAVDFSAAMAALAVSHFPVLKVAVADAERLPFPPASFEAVVTNFGLLHMARPEQALEEAQRVLRHGRVGFTVWAPPEEAVAFGIVLGAVQAHGNPEAPLPPGPPFFRFSDAGECRQALLQAGFRSPQVTRVDQTWRLRSADELFEAMQSGTVRTGGLLRAQSGEAMQGIRAAIRQATSAYEEEGGIELPMPAVLAWAVKA